MAAAVTTPHLLVALFTHRVMAALGTRCICSWSLAAAVARERRFLTFKL